jgi:hypothetical protein
MLLDNAVWSWCQKNNKQFYSTSITSYKPSLGDSYKKPIDIAIETVKDIALTMTPPFTLFLSGGIDSQAMLYAWHRSKIPYKALCYEYIDNERTVYNYHDIKHLKPFAEKYKIPITYCEQNLVDFLENKLDDYAEKYQCSSPQICNYMNMIDQVPEGTVLLSGNFIMKNIVPLNYTLLGLERYRIGSQRSVIPFFFLTTTRLAYSFNSIAERFVNESDSYRLRYLTYRAAGFPVVPQEKKYSGFEGIKQRYENTLPKKLRLKYSKKLNTIDFDIRFRYPYEDKFGYNDELLININ